MSTGHGPDAPMPGAPRVFSLLLRGPGEVLLGSHGRGLRRSRDGGDTWEVPPGIPGSGSVNVLALDGAAILAGTTGTGVHRSGDGGETWAPVATGLEDATVYALASAPADAPGSLVAGTRARGLFTLGGAPARWHPVEGIGADRTVFRALHLGDGALLVATDDGVWWVPPGGSPARREGLDGLEVHALAAAPGGVLAGTSGGGVALRGAEGSWRRAGEGLPDDDVHCLAVGADGRVLAGTGAGPAHTTDGGRWRPVEGGPQHQRIFAVAVGDDGTCFAGGYSDVWRALPGVDRWELLPTGLSEGDLMAVAAGPDGALLTVGGRGVARSFDGGARWEPVDPGGHAAMTYAAVCTRRGRLLVGTDDGLLVLDDGRWAPVGPRGVRVVSLAETPAGTLLAGTIGDRVLASRDGGATWEQSGTGVDVPMVFDVLATRRAVLAAGGAVVGGRKTGGVYRSDDDGRTWGRTASPPLMVYRLAEDASGRVLAGGARCVVLRSDDGGATWSASQVAGDGDVKLYALLAGSEGVFVGCDAGVARSDDGAATWGPPAALDGATPFGLAEPAAGRLVAATSDGLRWSDDGGRSWRDRSGDMP